jgi:hypothetical protein
MIPYIIKPNSVSMFPAGEAPILIDSSHVNFKDVVESIKAFDFEGALDLARVVTFVHKVSHGAVSISDEGVTYKGTLLTGYLASKLMGFFTEGLPVAHYCNFLDNLMSNPSMTSRNELYLFLEAANLPITEEGCFLAYKAVRSDFRDKHSGKFDNSPGVTHVMERHDVDDNRNETCSYGFHAAAYDYAKNFMSGDDKLVAVKINPADVVSVPSDYNNQKLRCCKYTVAFEIKGANDIFKDMHYATSATAAYNPEENSYFWGAIWNDDEDGPWQS